MIYIGNNENVEFAINKLDIEMTHIRDDEGACYRIAEAIEFAIASDDRVIAIDLLSCEDSEEEIIKELTRLKELKRPHLLIILKGFIGDETIIGSLKALGISHFIFDDTLSPLKESIKAFLESESTYAEDEEVLENRANARMKVFGRDYFEIEENKKISIGVVSGMARMGTTTACIQLVKVLNSNRDKSACYIESNDSSYLDQLKASEKENIKEDVSLNLIRYAGVDHYMDASKIKKIESEGYTYYVYDYGIYDESKKGHISHCDLIIMLIGIKPSEEDKTYSVAIKTAEHPHNAYLYNFVDEKSKEKILGENNKTSKRSYFLSYTPNAYVVNKGNMEMIMKLMDDFRQDSKEDKTRNKGIINKLFGR